MYAAAGGASLASRQARQRQRQNKKLQLQKTSLKELKPHQAKQYHNYTDDLAGPNKLSSSSRVEKGTLRPPVAPSDRRHSSSTYQLKEPSTRSRLRESPSISIPISQCHHHSQVHHHHQHHHQQHQQPSTPGTVVGDNHVLSSPTLQLPQILIPEDGGKLERRCSFVRQVEEMEKCQEGGLLDRCNHLCNFEIKDHKMWDAHHYDEKEVFGSLDYPFSEIHDTSYGAGSDDNDFFSVYHQSAAANALLYVGLGTTAIGSVIFFVGTGEKGFKTLELRLIGPTLIACGLLCCLIRVLLCAFPSTCFRRKKMTKTRLPDDYCPHNTTRYHKPHHEDGGGPTTALLSKSSSSCKKKVSIVPPSHQPVPSTSNTQQAFVKDLVVVPVVPEINLPSPSASSAIVSPSKHRDSSSHQSIIELQSLELVYDLQSVSSNESDEEVTQIAKHTRTRQPANLLDAETSLISGSSVVVIEGDDNRNNKQGSGKNNRDSVANSSISSRHSGIVLSPLQLQGQ